MWDYAGQQQYYAAHEMFLSDSQAVFMVVVRLSTPRAEREQELEYWLRFIATRFSASSRSLDGDAGCRAQVALVFSHADARWEGMTDDDTRKVESSFVSSKLRFCEWASGWGERMAIKYRTLLAAHVSVHERVFVMDCQASRHGGCACVSLERTLTVGAAGSVGATGVQGRDQGAAGDASRG